MAFGNQPAPFDDDEASEQPEPASDQPAVGKPKKRKPGFPVTSRNAAAGKRSNPKKSPFKKFFKKVQ